MTRAALLALALGFIAAPVFCDDAATLGFLRGRLEGVQARAREDKPTDWGQTNGARLALAALIALYQGVLSTQDGAVCSFSVSCSQYAKLAIERYGPVRGLLMAADRFQRCNGWGSLYYPRDPNTGKLHDPLP